jgi:hypothetical protein
MRSDRLVGFITSSNRGGATDSPGVVARPLNAFPLLVLTVTIAAATRRCQLVEAPSPIPFVCEKTAFS